MTKASFSFRAIRAGSYLYRFFLGKMSRRPLRNAAVGVAAAFVINSASAQCDLFKNADAANPLMAVLDKTKTIAGFAFADIDGDGDQDAYVDFLGKDEAHGDTLHLYRNTGTKTHPVFKEDKNTGFGNNRAGGQNGMMQFVDIDGDGDLDYFASDSAAYYYDNSAFIYFFKNVGTPQVPKFVSGSDDFLPPLSANYIQPFAFADIDGDGDYDLYAADVNPYALFSYYEKIYYNIGTPQQPVYDKGKDLANGDGRFYKTFYDWNKDGLLDYFGVDAYYPISNYHRNIGPKDNPQYVDDSNGPKFRNRTPYRIIDLNNDGTPEVFDFNAHYSVLTPIAVIEDTIITKGNKQYTVLRNKNGGSGYRFRWEYNGETIIGADKSYIYPTQAGIYTLYVTNECGTGVSLNYELKKPTFQPLAADSKTAGFATSIGKIGIKAYPNPFVNSITLQLPGTLCNIKITDIAGRVLLKQTTSANTFHTGETLKPGTYTVTVFDGSGKLFSTIIIKQ